MFNSLNIPFFWFDVDCEITQELRLIDDLNSDVDIASVRFEGKSLIEPPLLVMDIIHYFAPTNNTRNFLVRWKELCDLSTSESVGDHRLFSQTLREFKPKGLNWQPLPREYAYGPHVKLGLARDIPSRKVAMAKVHHELSTRK
jgi:hypothetical protein